MNIMIHSDLDSEIQFRAVEGVTTPSAYHTKRDTVEIECYYFHVYKNTCRSHLIIINEKRQ
jgi:hypothetical protein